MFRKISEEKNQTKGDKYHKFKNYNLFRIIKSETIY